MTKLEQRGRQTGRTRQVLATEEPTYRVADGIKYRREGFGAIVLSPSRGCRLFNATAARIIEACRNARSLEQVLETARLDDELRKPVHEFLETLAQQGILARGPPAGGSRARFFFTDVEAFESDHLYMPLGVEAEVTLKCFRDCAYCAYESNARVDTSDNLSAQEWKRILRSLDEAGVFFLRFTGGDPFARDDFGEILRFADDLGFVLSVGSDLTILNEDHVRLLASLKNFGMLQTTLDGASPETADLLRGPGNFDRVVRGMRMLRAAGVPFIVGTVLSKRNVSEVRKIGELVGGHGALGYCVAPLYAAGRARGLADLVPSNDDLKRAAEQFRDLVVAGVVRPADPAFLPTLDESKDPPPAGLWEDQPYLIRQADRGLRIDSRGRCYTSIKLKEAIQESAFLGSLKDTPLGEIWNGSRTLKVLRGLPPKPDSYFGRVVDVRTAAIQLKG